MCCLGLCFAPGGAWGWPVGQNSSQARELEPELLWLVEVRDKQEPELKGVCWTAKLNGSYFNHDTATATVSIN